jgi:hypothetical protein
MSSKLNGLTSSSIDAQMSRLAQNPNQSLARRAVSIQ